MKNLKLTSFNKYENDKDIDKVKLNQIEVNLKNIINEKCLLNVETICFDNLSVDTKSTGGIRNVLSQLMSNTKLNAIFADHCKGDANREEMKEIETVINEIKAKGKIKVKSIVNISNKHKSPLKIFLNSILNHFPDSIESMHVDERYLLLNQNINNDNNNNNTNNSSNVNIIDSSNTRWQLPSKLQQENERTSVRPFSKLTQLCISTQKIKFKVENAIYLSNLITPVIFPKLETLNLCWWIDNNHIQFVTSGDMCANYGQFLNNGLKYLCIWMDNLSIETLIGTIYSDIDDSVNAYNGYNWDNENEKSNDNATFCDDFIFQIIRQMIKMAKNINFSKNDLNKDKEFTLKLVFRVKDISMLKNVSNQDLCDTLNIMEEKLSGVIMRLWNRLNLKYNNVCLAIKFEMTNNLYKAKHVNGYTQGFINYNDIFAYIHGELTEQLPFQTNNTMCVDHSDSSDEEYSKNSIIIKTFAKGKNNMSYNKAHSYTMFKYNCRHCQIDTWL